MEPTLRMAWEHCALPVQYFESVYNQEIWTCISDCLNGQIRTGDFSGPGPLSRAASSALWRSDCLRIHKFDWDHRFSLILRCGACVGVQTTVVSHICYYRSLITVPYPRKYLTLFRIGLAIAERLGQEGAAVVICSRNQKNVDDAVKYLKSKGIAKVSSWRIFQNLTTVMTYNIQSQAEGIACHIANSEHQRKLIDFVSSVTLKFSESRIIY